MLCYWIKKGVTFECFKECFLFIGGGRLKRIGGSYFLQLDIFFCSSKRKL